MHLPEPRGPLSASLCDDLAAGTVGLRTRELTTELTARDAAPADVLTDEDLQLALAVCYELHYRGFDGVSDDWEWDPQLLAVRAQLEAVHLAALRGLVPPVEATGAPIEVQLAEVIAADDGRSLSAHMAKHATADQWREYLTVKSVYHLKEGDPHTWVIPRIGGRAKAAAVEIQADEYGGGSPGRMHSQLFAGLMTDLGLDDGYGALWDVAPAVAFSSVNTMSLLGLHRRWRGACLGHLTVIEMTSSAPSRRYSAGLRRLGHDERTTVFYDEHVEADAVHEQIASVDMCGSFVAEEPDRAADVLFGAQCSLALDALTAEHLLTAWEAGRSGLLTDPRALHPSQAWSGPLREGQVA